MGRPAKAGSATHKPKWRNRQTRTTQNRVPSGNEGSIPSFGTRTARNYTLMGMATETSSMQEDVFISYTAETLSSSFPRMIDFSFSNNKMKPGSPQSIAKSRMRNVNPGKGFRLLEET